MAISLGLAFQVSDASVYVTNLAALEKIGGAQEIVISKSGVLTKAEQTKVRNIFSENKLFENDIDTRFMQSELTATKDLIIENIMFNSKGGRIEMEDNAIYMPKGDFVDRALIQFLLENDIEMHIQSQSQRESMLAFYIPFSSYRMRTTTALYLNSPSATSSDSSSPASFVRVYSKGAPEFILHNCSSCFDEHA